MSTPQNKTFGLIKFGTSTYEVVPLQIEGSRIRVEFGGQTGAKNVKEIFDQIKYIKSASYDVSTFHGKSSNHDWMPLSKQKLKWLEAFYDIMLSDWSRICMSGTVMPSDVPPQQFYTK